MFKRRETLAAAPGPTSNRAAMAPVHYVRHFLKEHWSPFTRLIELSGEVGLLIEIDTVFDIDD